MGKPRSSRRLGSDPAVTSPGADAGRTVSSFVRRRTQRDGLDSGGWSALASLVAARLFAVDSGFVRAYLA
jgi:hypothetical protein